MPTRKKAAAILDAAQRERRPLTVAEFQTVTKPRAARERDEQVAFVARCRAAGVVVTAVPNQGGNDVSAIIRGKKLLAEGFEPGYPDLIFDEARGGYFGLRLEFKRQAYWPSGYMGPLAKGEPTARQSDVHSRLVLQGYAVFVVWGADAGWSVLTWYRALPLTLDYVRHQPRGLIFAVECKPLPPRTRQIL